MANGTVSLGVNVELLAELGTDFLSSPFPFRRFPVEFGDKFDWANMWVGVAVAVDTPSHRQVFGLENFFHGIDTAVASDAAYAAIDVGGMVEKYEIGQFVNSQPGDGFVRRPALMHGAQLGAGRMHCAQRRNAIGAIGTVAIDARCRGRNRCLGPLLHVDVAIATIHFQLARVQLVAKRHRLSRHIARVERYRVGGP